MMKRNDKTKKEPLKEVAKLHSQINKFMAEKKKSQQYKKLIEYSEARYRRLFETAQDGILILDADTEKIVDVNPFLMDMLGYSTKDFIGKKLWELGFFKDAETSLKAFAKLPAEKYIRYEDLPLRTKDGCKVQVEFISNLYMVDHKKVIQCNIRDITKRK